MSQVYLSIPTDEERLNGEKHTPSIRHDARLWRSVGQTALKHWAWVGHLVLLSISMTLFTLSFCKDHEKLSDLAYTEKFSSYSPVAPVVKYSSQRYNLTPIVEGPYVGFGDAVDKEWGRIADGVGDIMITEAELDRLGLPRNSLKVKNEKTGEVGYRAAVEVIHQLHCLNYLRQFVHADYYNQRESDLSGHDGIEDQMGHADHCIETLRMNLMCQSDIGIFTFRLYPEYGYANDDYWPDFSTLHTCRNFEDIWQWAFDNTVSWTHDS